MEAGKKHLQISGESIAARKEERRGEYGLAVPSRISLVSLRVDSVVCETTSNPASGGLTRSSQTPIISRVLAAFSRQPARPGDNWTPEEDGIEKYVAARRRVAHSAASSSSQRLQFPKNLGVVFGSFATHRDAGLQAGTHPKSQARGLRSGMERISGFSRVHRN